MNQLGGLFDPNDQFWLLITSASIAWGAYMGSKYDRPIVGSLMGFIVPTLMRSFIETVKESV